MPRAAFYTHLTDKTGVEFSLKKQYLKKNQHFFSSATLCWMWYDGRVRHFTPDMKYESLQLTFADLFPCAEYKRSSLNRQLQSHKYDIEAPMTNLEAGAGH